MKKNHCFSMVSLAGVCAALIAAATVSPASAEELRHISHDGTADEEGNPFDTSILSNNTDWNYTTDGERSVMTALDNSTSTTGDNRLILVQANGISEFTDTGTAADKGWVFEIEMKILQGDGISGSRAFACFGVRSENEAGKQAWIGLHDDGGTGETGRIGFLDANGALTANSASLNVDDLIGDNQYHNFKIHKYAKGGTTTMDVLLDGAVVLSVPYASLADDPVAVDIQGFASSTVIPLCEVNIDFINFTLYDNLIESTPVDVIKPTLVSTNPASGNTKMPPSANLVANFSEEIALGTSGDVIIRNLTNPADIVISLGGSDPDGTLTVSSNQLIIDPAANLVAGDQYVVEIGATVVKDLAGLFYDGLLATDVPNWSFSVDNTPPSLLSITDDVAGGPVLTGVQFNYTVTFDEPVNAATVNIDDFENGITSGPAGTVLGSLSPTDDPAVFTLTATTTSAGSLKLRIKPGAVIEDLQGEPLNTTSAPSDDTTIKVYDTPTTGLIHNWTFDAGSLDWVGGKHATAFGDAAVTASTAKIGGGAATFDGGGDYMLAGTTGDFGIGTGTLSVSFWFKVVTPRSSDRFLGTGAGLNNQKGWVVFHDATVPGRVSPGMSDGGGRRIQKGNANGAVNANDGQWHLAVAVFDHNGTNGTVTTYLDSVKETTLALENLGTWNGSSIDNTYPLTFGGLAQTPAAANNLHGFMDDVAIWNRALSQSDVDALWNAGAGRAAASLGSTPTNGFADWIGGFDDLGQDDRGFNDDPDGDGLANGVEAFFGTAPGSFSAGLTQVSKSGTSVIFRHPNPDMPLDDVTGSYQWSPDLANWHAANGVDSAGGTTINAVATPNAPTPNVTTVEATITGPVPDKLFLRVVAATP
jgi:hypothetical protein